MRWIQLYYPFSHIYTSSSSIIKTVQNSATLKSPSRDSFIYSQNVLQEGRWTYLMRWIQWNRPFGRTSPCCGDMAKNVTDFGIFKHPSTDSFIYNQNILWVGGWTYSMRWIRWRCLFGRTGPGWGDIAKNLSHLRLLPTKLMKNLNISTTVVEAVEFGRWGFWPNIGFDIFLLVLDTVVLGCGSFIALAKATSVTSRW